MKFKSLKDLMVDKLYDIYSAEQSALDFFPKLTESCNNEELKKALLLHADQSRTQVKRLEQVFSKLDIKPEMKSNPVIDSLISNATDYIQADADPDVKDAALIAVEQQIEHYEIAAYGTARAWARMLNMSEAEKLFEDTLIEESYTDEKLTKLAEKGYGGGGCQ